MNAAATTGPSTYATLLRRCFTLFLATLVATVLIFLAIFGMSLYQAGRDNAASQAAALEQYVRRSLEVSAVVGNAALGHLQQRGSLKGLAEDREAHLYFSNLSDGMSIGEGMIFVDSDGMVVVHSDSYPAPPVDLSDRAWFRSHLDGADRVLDGSFVSRITGTLLFVHTFALRDDEGVFHGAVNIGIPSDTLLGAHSLPFDGRNIITTVAKVTGEILARDPFPDDLIGTRLDIPAEILEDSAIFEVRSTDGRRALTAYSHLSDVGLVASVSIPLAVILQPLTVTALVTLPLLMLIVIGALLTLRHLEAQQKTLFRSKIRLETVLNASSLGAWQWFPKIDKTDFMGRWGEMLGYHAEELSPNGATWRDLLHPDEAVQVLKELDRVLRGEQDEFCQEHRLRHKDGHWIWVFDCGRVVERDATGEPEVVFGIHLDISERRLAEERMRAISQEVDHRSKNLLAVVQALVSMTRMDSEKTFKATLRGRILALSRAHDLLSRTRWKGADMRMIAQEELAPYAVGNATKIVIEGPRAVLEASAIQSVAMALHELATNAAKHGALCVEGGRLRLTWNVPKSGPTFEILWEETVERAPVKLPMASGFGSRLISLMIESQLGGTLETKLSDNGLSCRMSLPKSLLMSVPSEDFAPASSSEEASAPRLANSKRRIFVVEDEALIAAETKSRLEDADYVVTWSASTLLTATSMAKLVDIEAAVLDVNLGGELSFPVADILLSRRIPFVFMTGYHRDGLIPKRFGKILVVRKPCPPDELETALLEALSRHDQQPDQALDVS